MKLLLLAGMNMSENKEWRTVRSTPPMHFLPFYGPFHPHDRRNRPKQKREPAQGLVRDDHRQRSLGEGREISGLNRTPGVEDRKAGRCGHGELP